MVVRLMIDGTQVEIGLQLPVGTLDVTDGVIVVPAGAFIESLHVDAEVIYADVRVHVILCLDLHAVLLVEQIVGDVTKVPVRLSGCSFLYLYYRYSETTKNSPINEPSL